MTYHTPGFAPGRWLFTTFREILMRTVYKYPIAPNSLRGHTFPVEIKAPRGAVPRFVGLQNGSPFLWAEVDTDQPEETQVVLHSVGTGFGAVPDGATYFQSLIQPPYVWHFYHP